jgi:toxin ParE1/3/4
MRVPETLTLLTAARVDIAEIWQYTHRTWGQTQADRYVNTLFEACWHLTEHPSLGRPQAHIHATLRTYHHAHHQLFYLVDGSNVTFIAFLHERMDIPRHIAIRLETPH